MRIGSEESDLRKRFTVEDLALPRATVECLRTGLRNVVGATDRAMTPAQRERWQRDTGFNTDGAFNHSLLMLRMAHDSSAGELVLQDDSYVDIVWPLSQSGPSYAELDDALTRAVTDIGGIYQTHFQWNPLVIGQHRTTAHPLGGCATADTVDLGVVDHAGRVFDPHGGVHPGLYVCDGSVIPRALGVNPFLTISMFAERAAELLRNELGLPAYQSDREGDDRV